MKVLGVTLRYPPHSRVGAWLQTHQCLVALRRRGHEVEVRTVHGGPNYEHDGIKVGPVGSTVSQWLDGVDVVISHHGDVMSNTAHAAKAAGVPHVLMVHGEVGRKPLADLVVCNSESQATRASRWKLPTIICRPHLDPSQHRSATGGRITLVNTTKAKGGHVFAQIARELPDREFLAVWGDWGNQTDYKLRNVEQIASTANMRFRVWRRTRILLMPSEKETWGMTGVEAMCSGIPVIAHPTPGLRESLGDAGIFVDRNDTKGWVEAIEQLDDPKTYMRQAAMCVDRANEIAAFNDVDQFVAAIEARFG